MTKNRIPEVGLQSRSYHVVGGGAKAPSRRKWQQEASGFGPPAPPLPLYRSKMEPGLGAEQSGALGGGGGKPPLTGSPLAGSASVGWFVF